MSLSTQIRRVAIKDYKSIAHCDVNLGPLTFLVGPNGSGKSNFLDALGFVADAVRHSLDYAVKARGGIREILRRSSDRPRQFGIRLDVDADLDRRMEFDAHFEYFLEIGAEEEDGYAVLAEECKWNCPWMEPDSGHFRIREGKLESCSFAPAPAAARDRLYLLAASGIGGPAMLFGSLSSISLYSLNSKSIRDFQTPGPGGLLARDGSNLVSVLSKLQRTQPDRVERVMEFLRLVVPAVTSVQPLAVGPKETLEFRESPGGNGESRTFYASSMSDGTLRALAILVALYQEPPGALFWSLVGIEEPEVALHPGAAEVLLDCLWEASLSRQVLVTTHSPDLLDRRDLPVDSILACSADKGDTVIGPVDRAGREMLVERLWTAGELMRIDQLTPDSTATPGMPMPDLRLFP